MPADMIKYMPFRQSASTLRQNRSTSLASAAKDHVTPHSDALQMSPDSPDGASLVSVYLAQPFVYVWVGTTGELTHKR